MKMWNTSVRFMVNIRPILSRNHILRRCFFTSCLQRKEFGSSRSVKSFHKRIQSLERSSSLQCYPYSNESTTDTTTNRRKQFKTIYKFESIVTVKVLSRLKIYQTGFMVCLIPISTYVYYTEQATLLTIESCLGLAGLATVSLYAISRYIQQIIGMISVNEDMSKVMISHLSFWGKRVDEVYKTEEIVPFSETGEDQVYDTYRKMTFFNNDKSLYLFLTGGKVYNKEKFESIFGSLS